MSRLSEETRFFLQLTFWGLIGLAFSMLCIVGVGAACVFSIQLGLKAVGQ